MCGAVKCLSFWFFSRILDSSYVLGSDCYFKNAILSSKS